ncbi:hypothetical protein [Pseudomonas phage D6]|nr:hypothetical protein [Pseudomonas phage D6]
MVGKRKHRIAKKMADRRNRLRSVLQLMLRAVYTPLLTEHSVRVVKAWARRDRLPMKQRRILHSALLKHKRAAYEGVIVRVLKTTDGENRVWQSIVVNKGKLEQFIQDNHVVSYNQGQGDVWVNQPELKQITTIEI